MELFHKITAVKFPLRFYSTDNIIHEENSGTYRKYVALPSDLYFEAAIATLGPDETFFSPR